MQQHVTKLATMNAARGGIGVLASYHAATALFLVLDIVAGINVRIAFLDGMPGWRAAYHAFCFACLAGMVLRPAVQPVIGALESAITLTALIIGMMLRSMFIPDFGASEPFDPVTIEEVINFMISGAIAYCTYVGCMKQFRGIS